MVVATSATTVTTATVQARICSHWAYHSTTADYDACESKCTKLNCSCFDYEGSIGPAPPAPAVNVSGPDGEVWVTHTKLDGHHFGVVLAAELKSDYSFSLETDMDMNSTGKYVSYEANATSTLSMSPTILLKACGKWDFQLHAVAPTLTMDGPCSASRASGSS